MPATERQDHERRLKANMALLEGRVLAEMERKHALRYKLVRFVERKKAVRRLRQAMRGVSGGNGSDSDESAKSDEESTKSDDEEMATQSVDEARLDVLYVMVSGLS